MDIERLKSFLVGGVNSPVRAFLNLGIEPPIFERSEGAYLYDISGKKYIDYIMSWGSLILGHRSNEFIEQLNFAISNYDSFGATSIIELKFAEFICKTQKLDMIRMVNSGTEATMTAIRLSRGYTKRKKIIKFSGNYHGHYDAFLVKAGSGQMTFNISISEGVNSSILEDTIVCEYNSIDQVKAAFDKYGDDIAAVIVEPIAANMGVVIPDKEFIIFLRKICHEYNSVLIFDEVITGFRIAYRGAREYFGVEPDLVTFGKIIGGGLPCGAVAGKREIMNKLAPIGNVYQAGTMSGNPIVMGVGLNVLNILYSNNQIYSQLEELALKFEEELSSILNKKGISYVINRCASMMTIFYTNKRQIKNYSDALESDINLFNRVTKTLIKNGIFIPPSQFEALFLSLSHSLMDIEKTIEIFNII